MATRQQVIPNWPNGAAIAACAANPPPPDGAVWKCADDCVQVMTHIWRGWMVVRHQRTGQLKLNCETFAQFHCKKPSDPDVEKPPVEGHPDGPLPEEGPDVTA